MFFLPTLTPKASNLTANLTIFLLYCEGLVVGDKPEEAYLIGKTRGILAGVPFFNGEALLDAHIDLIPSCHDKKY